MIVVRVLGNLHHLVVFVAYFLYELLLANIRVAYEVLTPTHHMRAAIIRVETRTETDLELSSLANAISMTPGTLSLEVDPVANDLYVHTLFLTSRERFLADIARMERLLLKALR
jgi:multicomponent Na+:H+ antiporter subunit E